MTDTTSRDVALIARIVEAGSLSAAARQMQVAPASISQRLVELERRLGVMLLRRSSRSLRLTQEGERFLSIGLPVLELLQAAEDAARSSNDAPNLAGMIRASAPSDLGRQYVVAMIDDFVTRHPAVHVALSLTDHIADLMEDDIDLAIRYGEMAATSGIAVRHLATNHRIVCGSPGYLDRVGRPEKAADLARFNCMTLRTSTNHIDRWPVGRSRVDVAGDRSTSDGAVLRSWAIQGYGLVLKSWWDVRLDLAEGRLESLFPDLPQVMHPLRLARPAGSSVPLRVTCLSDQLKAGFARIEQDGKMLL